MQTSKIVLSGTAVTCREWVAPEAATEAFLLLHGVESHSGWFCELGPALAARGYHVIAYDRPGWGESEGLGGHLASYADELTRLEALVTSLRVRHERVHLAGLSWGGLLALYAGLRRGVLFDSVSLIAPGICPKADLTPLDKLHVAGGIVLRNPLTTVEVPINTAHFTRLSRWADFISGDPLRNRRVTAAFCFESLKMRKFCAEFAPLRTLPPTALLLAGDDKIIDNVATRDLLEGNAAVEIHEFAGAEHSLVFECPAALADRLAQNATRRPDSGKTVAVLGAGAVGSAVGALLAQGGCKTVLIGRAAHAQAINERGLKLTLAGGARYIRDNLRAVQTPQEALQAGGQPDVLLVAVKSYDTAAALEQARELVGPHTVIISLQNGVGNEPRIAAAFPHHTVLGGAICAYLEFAAPGEVVWTDDRGGLAVGFFSGDRSRAEDAAKLLRQSGMQVIYAADAARVKWSKLLLNTAFNALNAATGLSTAEILAHPEYGPLAVQALREGFAVLQAQGLQPLDLPGYPVGKLGLLCKLPVWVAQKVLARVTAKEKKTVSSMRQDVTRGRGQTEIDEINGAIVAAGERAHLPTPANKRLCALMQTGA